MTSLHWIALVEKSLIFVIGLGFGWMGYRLLHAGLYEHAQQVKEASADGDLLWKQVLPGTTFALFAGVIVISGLYQPSVATLVAPSSLPRVVPTDADSRPNQTDAPPLDLDLDLDLETPSIHPFESRPLIPEAGSLLPFEPTEGSLPPLESGSSLGIPEAGSFLVE
jgi:hypothetical protein